MLRTVLLATVAVAGAVVAGCASTQSIVISADGGGSADITIDLSPVLVHYFQDLSASFSGFLAQSNQPSGVFDLAALRAAFSGYPNMQLVTAETPSDGILKLRVSFSDAGAVLAAGAQGTGTSAGATPGTTAGASAGIAGTPDAAATSGKAGTSAATGTAAGSASAQTASAFLSFAKSGSDSTLSITLNRSVVQKLLGLTPLSGTGAEILLPPAGYPMTPDAYADYLTWALGDYGSAGQLKNEIANSTIVMNIRVPGAIVDQEGGTVSGRVVRFTIGVPDLLTLTKSVRYSVTFR